jgi:EAL domain-containing protein (putative c-di-GMP-specific phosphodiesterase class I)
VMGLHTIAEFAENDEIIQSLKEIGVDYAQGYGVAMPELFEPIESLKTDSLHEKIHQQN